eukprot:m.350746 g.350746  ORF g.350746 m.350746 type:complete len:114 (+) comp16159_c0_seq4:3296-3637(+)
MRDATHLEATQDELQDLTRELIAGHINEAVVASTGDGEQGHAPGTQGADTDAGPHTAVGEGDQDSSRSVLYLYDLLSIQCLFTNTTTKTLSTAGMEHRGITQDQNGVTVSNSC